MKNLTTHEPWKVLQRLHSDLDRLLGPSGELDLDDDSSVVTSRWMPAVDIREEPDRFVITADVPGVDPDGIEVTMANGMLTIKGERKVEEERESSGFRRVERLHGQFHRRFGLPDHADPDHISARSENGVLEVVVPKTERALPRRIEVH